jgi:hypothetical protein
VWQTISDLSVELIQVKVNIVVKFLVAYWCLTILLAVQLLLLELKQTSIEVLKGFGLLDLQVTIVCDTTFIKEVIGVYVL